MAPDLWAAAPLRWAGFLALAVFIGGLGVDLFVFPERAEELAAARRRLRLLRLVCLAALIVTWVGELVLRASVMAGGGWGAAIAAAPTVLARTHFGGVWIARAVELAVALCAAPMPGRPARVIALLAGLGIAATSSATGHAGDWGDLTPSAALDWAHLTSGSLWVGGLAALAVAGRRMGAAWPPELFSTVARRFSRIAGWSLLAVVLTGLCGAWTQVGGFTALATTPYGRVLCVKIALVLGLVWLGAVCRFTLVSRLAGRGAGLGARLFRLGRRAVFGSGPVTRPRVPSRLLGYIAVEAWLGVAVLGATAVLVDTAPARHRAHAAHEAEAAAGPVHVTMEELHGRGGVPAGWRFSPPPGDAKKGREVFVKLGCFACHAVRSEGFPAPGAPGPDLTDVGRHHPPGYLLESVLNPDAVIVDAPGYTGADGRSTMPDFRTRLTTAELVDLVAYLSDLKGGR